MVFLALAPTLPPPGVTILGAIVGATAAIVAALITSWRLLKVERVRSKEARDLEQLRIKEAREVEQLRIKEAREVEQLRIKEAREDRVATELSAAVQQLTIKMSAALHSMCWLTWLARARADRVTQEWLDSYDAELHKILPEIQGYLTTVATLDANMYEKLEPLVRKIYALDAYLGEAGLWIDKDRGKMIGKLVDGYRAMEDLAFVLPQLVADLTSNRTRMPTMPGSVIKITDRTIEPRTR